jgi:hypothetical protein
MFYGTRHFHDSLFGGGGALEAAAGGALATAGALTATDSAFSTASEVSADEEQLRTVASASRGDEHEGKVRSYACMLVAAIVRL